MNPLKLRRFCQARRQLALGISLCLCLLVLASAAFAKTESVDKLIKQLKDKHEYIRASAAEMLGNSNDPRAVEPLIAALQDSDANVRAHVVIALGAIIDPRALEPLFATLKDTDTNVRMCAVDALRDFKDPRSIAPLIATFRDADSKVRDHADLALVAIGTPSVDPLIAALKDANANERDIAVWTLGRIADPRAVEPLIAALKDAEANVRIDAAVALGVLKAPGAVQPLIEALKDTNFDVVKRAAGALVNIGSPAFEPLLNMLKDSNANLRAYATDILSAIKDPRSVEPLITLLKDSNANVRTHTALALGEINDPRAVEPLIATLKDTDPGVRKTAVKALENLSDQHALEVIAIDRSIESHIREVAISHLTNQDILMRISNDASEVMVVRRAARPGGRRARLTMNDGTVMEGGLPLFLSTYDSTGNLAGGLSGSYDETLFDLSALGGETVTLGLQLANGSIVADSSLSPAVGESAFIDADGIVYSNDATTVPENGPFISIIPSDFSNKPLPIDHFSISAQSAGHPLTVRTENGTRIVEGVAKQTISLNIIGWSGTSSSRSVELFPRFRGATPTAVIFLVRLR